MKYIAIGWAVFVGLSLLFFLFKFLSAKISENDVIYLPKWIFYIGFLAHLLSGIVTVLFTDCLTGIFLSVPGVSMMLCQLNQKTTMISADTFRYQTMFGRKRLYSFSDIIGIEKSLKGNYSVFIDGMEGLRKRNFSLIMKDSGKIFVEESAVKDAAFMRQIKQTLQEQHIEFDDVL